MRPLFGLALPLFLLTAAFTASVPYVSAQNEGDLTYYTVSGRVLSDEDQPLAGVLVNGHTYPESDAQKRLWEGAGRNDETRTDEDGRFTLKLPEGRGWLNIYYEKWRQSDGRELVLDSNETVDFVLRTPPPKDAVIEGVVVDEKGEPIEGAEVSLQTGCCYAMPMDGGASASEPSPTPAVATDPASGSEMSSTRPAIMPPYHDDYQTMRTDEDGRFRFEAYAGPRQITAWAKGYAQTTVQVESEARETKTVEVELERVPAADAKLTGRVVDANTGLPLKGAQVNLRSLEWGRYAYAETGTDGRFELTTLPGWAELTVSYYAPYAEPMPADGTDLRIAVHSTEYYPFGQIIDLRSGDNPLDARLEAKPKGTVALIGYVVDPETKKAVEGARVNVWNHENGGWGEAITDATGSYRLMVRPGHYSGSAWKEGYLGGTQTFRVEDEPTQRIDILMPKGTTKWAPCYEEDASCGGPIMYESKAYADQDAGGNGATVATSAPMPAAAPGSTSRTMGSATLEGSNAQAGGDRSRSASFDGAGGGLPPYDADASAPAAQADATNPVPGAGVLAALVALGAAVLIARRT